MKTKREGLFYIFLSVIISAIITIYAADHFNRLIGGIAIFLSLGIGLLTLLFSFIFLYFFENPKTRLFIVTAFCLVNILIGLSILMNW